MIINGLYGTSNLKVQENGVNTVPKEETENTAVKYSGAADTVPAASDTGLLTYTENDIQKKSENSQEDEVHNEEAQQNNTSECMSREDYKAISEEGISLEKYNSERLARVLQRIKTQRAEKEETLSDRIESLNKKAEAIEHMAGYNTATKKIVRKLVESDLPVTEANIAKIATAMEMASLALNLTDKDISYLIGNNLEPTIENLYKARYSGSSAPKEKITDQTFAGLKQQVVEIIDNAGLETDEENMQSARWLLNNGLPLTDETLWAYRDLKYLKDYTDEDTLLNKTVEAFSSGKNPEAASLGHVAAEKAEHAIDAFHSISEEAIQEAVKNHEGGTEHINCRELQKVQKKVQKQLDKGSAITSGNQPEFAKETGEEETGTAADILDIKTITVRRQLEEIRLKMTLDSGQQLIKQGFKLDTDSLSKLVDGLRDLEDKYYKNLLKEGSAEINTENVRILKDSLQGMEELKGMPSYILGSTLSIRDSITVGGLLTAGSECRASRDKAGEAYETLMTKPRSDMGDSITKAFRNVDTILEDMKLEPTQANERAVRILGYNGIAITQENVLYVKAYDEQVNQLMKSFHPAVAAELIKKGTNPLNIPIEELNQQLESIQNELGVSEEEKYSRYLWKLEKNKDISEDEKKSYIGIYRLLNAVKKTDGAALGAVLKANQEVTMKNLLTAVRTMKSSGVDAAVDDSFGLLSQHTYTGENIADQVNASFAESGTLNNKEAQPDVLAEKSDYGNYLLKDVMDEITPGKLQFLGNTQDIMEMSVEKLKEELINRAENTEEENNYWNQKLKEYHEVTDQSENAQRILKSFDIPDSLSNIQAAKDLLSSDQTFYKQIGRLQKRWNNEETDSKNMEQPFMELADVSENLINAMTGPEDVKEQYQILEQEVNKLFNQTYDNPVVTARDISALQRINYGISLIHKLAGRESYEIPLAVGDNITNVNVTILRNTGEYGKVNISADSETLGKISVGLSVKEQGINALITCDNRTGLEAARMKSRELINAVYKSGNEIKQLNYGIGNNLGDFYRYTNYKSGNDTRESDYQDTAAVPTDTLYKLAKTFLVHIKEIESNLQ